MSTGNHELEFSKVNTKFLNSKVDRTFEHYRPIFPINALLSHPKKAKGLRLR